MNINIEKQLPDEAGEGIGKGAEALGKGLGKGAERTLTSLGKGGEAIGRGTANIPWSIGEWMRTHALQKNISKTIDLLQNKNFSRLFIACDHIEIINEPTTLVGSVQLWEEQNLRLLVKNIVEEIAYRENHEESIPSKLSDTANLLAIEKAAAETNDEDLSKMWARIFVEEATKPDSISRASIEILKKLDKKTATILQEQIFPYCTDDGWFLGMDDKFLSAKMIASDYGILYDYGIAKTLSATANDFAKQLCVLDIGTFCILGHFGYQFYTKDHLTEPALRIKNTLKIFPNNEYISKIGELVNDSKFWYLSKEYKITQNPNKEDYAIITDKEKETVLYPLNTYFSPNDYLTKINSNVEKKEKSGN